LYKESIEKPQWIIGSDTIRILSYLCRKAVCQFYGRIWTAWFAPNIPINAGPWKLSGLPGLILKASDNRNHYVFECIGIEEFQKKKQPIIVSKEHAVNCSRKEYAQVQKRFYNDMANTLVSIGMSIRLTNDQGKVVETLGTQKSQETVVFIPVKNRYKKIPYNPIELE
jgi:hypothetical protein